MLRYALFDLDNTLYPSNSGLWDAIGNRISAYMIERVGIRPEHVAARRKVYFRSFGNTLAGLRSEFQIDCDDFLHYVHDVSLEEYIGFDPALEEMLDSLPLRKIIFTNADAAHAVRVLNQLGIARHFEKIVDIRMLEFDNKPNAAAYQKILEFLPARAEECVYVEDSIQNIIPARALGMLTVLVQEDESNAGAHHQITGIAGLKNLLAEILDGSR